MVIRMNARAAVWWARQGSKSFKTVWEVSHSSRRRMPWLSQRSRGKLHGGGCLPSNPPYVTNDRLLLLMRERSAPLWRTVYQIAHGVIRRYYGEAPDPEDLAQIAVETCFRKLDSFDPARGAPFAFLSGVCHLAMHDYLRREKRQSLADFAQRLRRVRARGT